MANYTKLTDSDTDERNVRHSTNNDKSEALPVASCDMAATENRVRHKRSQHPPEEHDPSSMHKGLEWEVVLPAHSHSPLAACLVLSDFGEHGKW